MLVHHHFVKVLLTVLWYCTFDDDDDDHFITIVIMGLVGLKLINALRGLKVDQGLCSSC